MEKKLDGNYTRMVWAILNKHWRQYPTKQQLYGHLTPITKTNQLRHCWRNGDKLISDILLWTPSHGRTKAGRPAGTYVQQLCADTGYSLKDLPGAPDDRDGWMGEGQGDQCWQHDMMMMMTATSLWEGKLWIQTSTILLKNWPSVTFCLWWRGLVNTYCRI